MEERNMLKDEPTLIGGERLETETNSTEQFDRRRDDGVSVVDEIMIHTDEALHHAMPASLEGFKAVRDGADPTVVYQRDERLLEFMTERELTALLGAYTESLCAILEKRGDISLGPEYMMRSHLLLKPDFVGDDLLNHDRLKLVRTLLDWTDQKIAGITLVTLDADTVARFWPKSKDIVLPEGDRTAYDKLCANFKDRTVLLVEVEGMIAIERTLALKKAFRAVFAPGNPGALIHSPDDEAEVCREISILRERSKGAVLILDDSEGFDLVLVEQQRIPVAAEDYNEKEMYSEMYVVGPGFESVEYADNGDNFRVIDKPSE
jgi:hypothetical protein